MSGCMPEKIEVALARHLKLTHNKHYRDYSLTSNEYDE
jgi:hypothetical protein